MNKSIIQYSIAVLLSVIAIRMLWQDNYLALLKEISLFDLLLAVFLSLSLIISYGVTLRYLILKQHGAKISTVDLVTLPMMMNFWGYIIPLRGGVLYSLLFLKAKYKVKLVDSAAITVYMHMVMASLIGLIGLIYLTARHRLISVLSLCSLIFLLNPLILSLINVIIQRFSLEPSSVFGKLQHLTNTVISNSNTPLTNMRTTSAVAMLILMRFFTRAALYYWAAFVFNLEIPITAFIILTLAIEFAMFALRFSPGNLGVNELMSGGILGILGGASQEGILMELFCRFANLLLTFTAGVWAVITNMKYFNVSSFKSLWSKVKAS